MKMSSVCLIAILLGTSHSFAGGVLSTLKNMLPTIETKPQIPAGVPKEDFVLKGYAHTSIYFNASISDDVGTCQPNQMSNIQDSKGVALMKVCTGTVKVCLMEGVCQINRKNEARTFNFHGYLGKRPAFFELKNGDCVYGFGVQSGCLDPFYTLAADLRHHKAGDVIYVPAIAGVVLPGGQKHSGYFVIRDKGGRIDGANRFDFFTGPVGWKSKNNPFFALGLSASTKKFHYYKVRGATAQRILHDRNFPKLPDDPMFDSLKGSN
ncbi:MAG: 3D domain-containing protein [Pseudobdellovibrionaceae bacterium]